jgi:hypothetical protein
MFRRLNVHIENFHENIRELRQNSARMYELSKASYLKSEMESERNRDDKRLLKYGYRRYSQNDEDGLIAEIFAVSNRQQKPSVSLALATEAATR